MSRFLRLLLAVAAVLVCLAFFFYLPCMQRVKIRDGEGWGQSAANLRDIGEALHSYHDVYGKLPPAVVHGVGGRPLYSWRVALLPFLEQDPLYRQFKLDEPWDSPHNKPLSDQTPPCYPPLGLGGGDATGLTRYQDFVGPGTAFERLALTWKDFPDGLENTLLVAEAGEPVPWAKPADLVYDPGKPLPPLGGVFGKPVHFLCYEVGRRPGIVVCFADASTRFLRGDSDKATLRALITRNGGEAIDWSKVEWPPSRSSQ
jgi:hypothetical protein